MLGSRHQIDMRRPFTPEAVRQRPADDLSRKAASLFEARRTWISREVPDDEARHGETRRHDSAGDAEAEAIRDESLERTVE
jgi:hypothetical protein